MSDGYEEFLSLEKHLPALAGEGWRAVLRQNLDGFLRLRHARELCAALKERVEAGDEVFEAFLDLSGIVMDAEGVTEAIPDAGPLVIVANHPFGGADATVMSTIATRARGDIKVLANAELAQIPGMAPWLLPLQILGEPGAERANVTTLRSALAHLREGGVLVIFPGGAVAHWQWESARVEDPPWPGHAARLIRKTGAPVLPVRFFGANPAWFQLLGAIHPLVRSALIPRAFFSMAGQTVQCRAGDLLTSDDLPSDPEALTRALRTAVYAVSDRPGNWIAAGRL